MDSTRLIYEVDQLPVFQNRMYDSKNEALACPKGDIRLVEDLGTGLIFNEAFRQELMVYDGNYQNEQAVSRRFQRHLEEVAAAIDRTIGRDCLIEVGCGKGHFLEMLLASGFDVTGFDPTYEGTNPRVQRKYFAPTQRANAKGLILRHVLEHIQNPVKFLRFLRDSNGGSGRVYIEVPCFDWICERKSWYDIFYEHVNYFRLTDLKRCFRHVIESGKIFGGQYIYICADLSSLVTPSIDNNIRVAFPSAFTRSIGSKIETDLNGCAIWGGASKGVIFSLLKARAGQVITTVIDINPAKQGKFLPVTGIQVKSPKQGLAELRHGATIYVMNSNYIDEIKEMSNNLYNYVQIDHERI